MRSSARLVAFVLSFALSSAVAPAAWAACEPLALAFCGLREDLAGLVTAERLGGGGYRIDEVFFASPDHPLSPGDALDLPGVTAARVMAALVGGQWSSWPVDAAGELSVAPQDCDPPLVIGAAEVAGAMLSEACAVQLRDRDPRWLSEFCADREPPSCGEDAGVLADSGAPHDAGATADAGSPAADASVGLDAGKVDAGGVAPPEEKKGCLSVGGMGTAGPLVLLGLALLAISRRKRG